jgi:hypothetical protein
MPRSIETHLLDGPAGKLEALLEAPEDTGPRAAALVCHPHPLFGGSMHNKVVHRVARALRTSGYVVLRFNSRMRARRSTGCAAAIRACPIPWRGFPSAPEWS